MGWERLLQPLGKVRVLAFRSRTGAKVSRRMAWQSMMENQTSARLSQEPLVGVKWTWSEVLVEPVADLDCLVGGVAVHDEVEVLVGGRCGRPAPGSDRGPGSRTSHQRM